MAFVKCFSGRRRVAILAAIMVSTFIILLPTTIKIVSNAYFPGTEYAVQIDTVSYLSSSDPSGESQLIVGNLYHPMKNISRQCPAIIVCHGLVWGIGKETMTRWAAELAKREYVVLCIDVAGQGSSLGSNYYLPSIDIEPYVIADGIAFLKTLPYVNASAIGLMGISYGGSTVCFAAGVLGNLINATVAMSPATNWTNWFIHDFLPIRMEIDPSEIIESAENITTGLTVEQANALLEMVSLWHGASSILDSVFIPGTSVFNRTILEKFDPVEILHNATPNSVMFIQGNQDELFALTNQSGQGFDVTPGATLIQVNDTHNLISDPTHASDYAFINFFDEKLKGVVLPVLGSDLQTYTQQGDIQLTSADVFTFDILGEIILVWVAAVFCIALIMNLVVYEKRYRPLRIVEDEAQFVKTKVDEEPCPDLIKKPKKPAYAAVFIHLSLMLGILYGTLTVSSLGIFASQVTVPFMIAFYIASYMAIRNLPNDAELVEDHQMVGRNAIRKEAVTFTKKDYAIMSILIAISGAIGAISTGITRTDNIPGGAIMRVFFFTGLALTTSAFAFIIREKKKQGDSFSWEQFHLSKARIIRGLTLGIIIFANVVGLWQYIALILKLPFPLSPHSIEYVFGLVGIILFTFGLEIWVECIMRSSFSMDGMRIKERIRPRARLFGVGCIVVFVVSFIAYLPFWVFTIVPLATIMKGVLPTLLPILNLGPFLLPLLCVLAYSLIRMLNIFSAERDATYTATFYPLIAFWLIAFLFHL